MSLETDIQTASTKSRKLLKLRHVSLKLVIRRMDCAARLMPVTWYGKPIDRDAIARSLRCKKMYKPPLPIIILVGT